MRAGPLEKIAPSDLLDALRTMRGELAVLDVREESVFATGHILLASSLPLSRLERDGPRLVPRTSTPIVVCDDGDGLAELAQNRLRSLGYRDIAVLDGGMRAWIKAGYEVFSGLNAPSKALGVFVAKELSIPEITCDELAALKEKDVDIRVVDCRPYVEYQRGSIPGALNAPGVELLRLLVGGEVDFPLVVTCAGRTRGLLGTQSLIDAGAIGRIAALHNGTMGWELSKRALEKKAERKLENISKRAVAPTEVAKSMRLRGEIPVLDETALGRWLTDKDRTTYLFDIRTRKEFEAGHFPSARHVVGGQLVQNLDMHVASQGARIVLSDDDGVRASTVALWLRRMGWSDIAIAPIEGQKELEVGGERSLSAALPNDVKYVEVEDLKRFVENEDFLLIDLANSRNYRAGHIPGAWFAIRSQLSKTLPTLPKTRRLIFTSEDGIQAAFACADETQFEGEIRALKGGTAAWKAAGNPLSQSTGHFADAPDEIVSKPSELTEGREQAMRDYLSGSDDLLEKVERDASLHLVALPMR